MVPWCVVMYFDIFIRVPKVSRRYQGTLCSLPEFMNFKLFGKAILVVHLKFGVFWPSTQEVSLGMATDYSHKALGRVDVAQRSCSTPAPKKPAIESQADSGQKIREGMGWDVKKAKEPKSL